MSREGTLAGSAASQSQKSAPSEGSLPRERCGLLGRDRSPGPSPDMGAFVDCQSPGERIPAWN